MHKIKLRLTLLILALLLAGCASHFNERKTLALKAMPQNNEGVLVARIVNASSYPLPFNSLTINPENLNESKKIKPANLETKMFTIPNTTIFAASLESGNYALNSISVWHTNGNFYWAKAVPADAKFGTFEVRSGQVTDLGTLIYYQKPDGDKYFQRLERLPSPQPGEVLTKYFQFYSFDSEQVLSWHHDDSEEERQSTFVSMVQNPTLYNKTYLAPDGSIYFLGKLGAIIIRDKNGNWDLDAVDTNLDLTAIVKNARGDLIVGGLEGRLFWKPNGSEWLDISLDHKMHIAALSTYKTDHVDMIVRKKDKLFIYRAKLDGDNPNWSELNRYRLRYDDWKRPNQLIDKQDSDDKKKKKKLTPKESAKNKYISNAQLQTIQGEMALTITYKSLRRPMFSRINHLRFKVNQEDWETSPLIIKDGISSTFNAGAINIGVEEPGFWSWSGKPTYKRFDKSKNQWTKINTNVYICNNKITKKKKCVIKDKAMPATKTTFNMASRPLFKNDLSGFVIASLNRSNAYEPDEEHKLKILKTTDGGSSWEDTKRTLPRDYCTALVTEVSDRLLLSCNGSTGDFYESNDDGNSWQHVRQYEDF